MQWICCLLLRTDEEFAAFESHPAQCDDEVSGKVLMHVKQCDFRHDVNRAECFARERGFVEQEAYDISGFHFAVVAGVHDEADHVGLAPLRRTGRVRTLGRGRRARRAGGRIWAFFAWRLRRAGFTHGCAFFADGWALLAWLDRALFRRSAHGFATRRWWLAAGWRSIVAWASVVAALVVSWVGALAVLSDFGRFLGVAIEQGDERGGDVGGRVPGIKEAVHEAVGFFEDAAFEHAAHFFKKGVAPAFFEGFEGGDDLAFDGALREAHEVLEFPDFAAIGKGDRFA